MELALGIAVVILLGSTGFLLFAHLERRQENIRLQAEAAEIRKETTHTSKKLDDQQARYDKVTAELARAQQVSKDLKQQLHDTREKLKKKKGQPVEEPEENADLRRAQARVEELTGELRDTRGRLKGVRTDLKEVKQKKEASLAEQVAKIAADEGGVSEADVHRAVQEARKETTKEVRAEKNEDFQDQIGSVRKRASELKRALSSAEIEGRKYKKRYEEAQRAYSITQGQLEMANDRLFFLETGTHRRAHRAESVAVAEMPTHGSVGNKEGKKKTRKRPRKDKSSMGEATPVAADEQSLVESDEFAENALSPAEETPVVEEAVDGPDIETAPNEDAGNEVEETPVVEEAVDGPDVEAAPNEIAGDEVVPEAAAEEEAHEEAPEEAAANEPAASEESAEAATADDEADEAQENGESGSEEESADDGDERMAAADGS